MTGILLDVVFVPDIAVTPLPVLVSRGAEVGAGVGFPPRGPLFSSSRLTNFLTPESGTAFRFTGGAAAAISGWSMSEDLASF